MFSYPAKEKPTAVVLLVHGLGEYAMRYIEWAEWFSEQNMAFTAFDLRGHGKSEGVRGDAASYEVLMDDIDAVYNKSIEIFPNVPVILYGHSMGGNLSLYYVLKRNKNFKALIITSPWLELAKPPSKWITMIAGSLERLHPSMIVKSGLKAENISTDPDVVKQYRIDPYIHDKISLRLFSAVNKAADYIMKHAGEIDIPMLLMHGGNDRITSHIASKRFAAKNEKFATLNIWDELYHELHNETIRDEVFKFIIDWLKIYFIEQ